MSEKIIYTYNNHFYSLLTEVKNISPDIKEMLESKYNENTKDMKTDTYMKMFESQLTDDIFDKLIHKNSTIDVLFTDEIQKLQIVDDLPLSKIVGTKKEMNATQFYTAVFKYLLNFILPIKLLNNVDSKSRDRLFLQSVIVLKESAKDGDNLEELLDNIDNSLIRKIVRKIALISNTKASNMASDFGGLFENDAIRNVALEVANELAEDPSLKIEANNMQDIMGLFASGKLQVVMEKAMKCVQSKIGESNLNQQTIIEEVMKIISKMTAGAGGSGGMPDLSAMAASMGGMPTPGQGGMPDLASLMGMFQNGMNMGSGARVDDSKLRKEKTKLRLQQKLETLKNQKQ